MRLLRRGPGLALAAFVAAALPVGRAAACTDLAQAPTTRWSLTTKNGVSWLVTPCGQPFLSLGVNALDGGYPFREKAGKVYYSWTAFAPSERGLGRGDPPPPRRLGVQQRRRLGLAAAGTAPADRSSISNSGAARASTGSTRSRRETATRMMALARELVAPYRNTPYRIGYFSDNEVGWWAGALFVFYSMKPADSATKQRWVETLRHYYGDDWARFTGDFLPPPGVAFMGGAARRNRDDADAARWRRHPCRARMVRHRCPPLLRARLAAIRAADPDALYFGDRLPIYYDPAAVRAMAPYVDAIATNYNVDASDGWIADYYFDGLRKLSGGKPVLVSEWFYAARQNRTGNLNNGHLMTVDTQAERAAGAAAATENFAAIPEIVGAHWFQYYDHPKGGRPDGEDYDFGLVDIDDQPYRRLTAALAAANRRASRSMPRRRRRRARRASSSFRAPRSNCAIARYRTGPSRRACCRG